MAETAQQSIYGCAASCLRRVLLQPFPKGCIQSLVLRPSYQPGLLDQVFVSAQGNVFHTQKVYTIFVYIYTLTFVISAKRFGAIST